MSQDAHEQLKMQGKKGPPKIIYRSSHGVITLQWDSRWPATSNNSNSKIKIGRLCSSTSHSATSLSNHDNNQLGGKASPMYPSKYFFSFVLLFLVCAKILK
jgi:hypothetical protein